MENLSPCPCPKLECPNHGNCENCTSRHLRLGFLNYCGFHAILPFMREVVEASPESPSAQMLKFKMDKQLNAYEELKKKYDLNDDEEAILRNMKSKLSRH
jgi:hypothetical protein